MPRHDGLHVPAREIVEHLHPVPVVGVGIAYVIARPPVHAQIAGEQDAFLRQERDRITNRMCWSDAAQLQPPFTVVEGHEIAEDY